MVSKLPTELLTELDNIMSYVRSGNKVGKRKMSVVGCYTCFSSLLMV